VIESYILIYAEAGRVGRVVNEVRALTGIAHADAVTGAYDVIARASAPSLDQFAQFVADRIGSIPGVLRTMICPAVSHDRHWEEQLEPAYAAV